MDKTNILDWINILILAFNGIVIYVSFYRDKNKDYEKHLFDKKLFAYEEINLKCSKMFDKIDLENSPFTEIYEINSKEDWGNYYEKNLAKLAGMGTLYFEEVQAKYGLIISNKVLTSLDKYTFIITRFVIESYHFDAAILVDKHTRAYDLLDKLRQEMRKDLKIEEINISLRNRLKEKYK